MSQTETTNTTNPAFGHKVYRALSRGPMLWGLPVMQLMFIFMSASLGFFVVKAMFGLIGGMAWMLIHGCVYGVLAFLASKDPMFLTMLLFHLSARFYPRLNSYEASRKKVTWVSETDHKPISKPTTKTNTSNHEYAYAT
jgi:type IV secretory pathway VirB3-like protein